MHPAFTIRSFTSESFKTAPIGLLAVLIPLLVTPGVQAQAYGEADRDKPGDEMIQRYLAHEASQLSTTFLDGTTSAEQWEQQRQEYERQYFYMLGLWPLPEKSPLQATITGTIERDGYHVDMLHYQSRPGLYVTGNLYRPPSVEPGTRLPAVFYVCGHSSRGRDGNKTAYQSHGIWFARHGYVCLVVDSLQLGEIASVHHGTYRENRWWWLSRGYTPAGVECWNGVRGIDYLVSRDDVDPDRVAVTGISGGGAATFWIAAADPRVRVAVPVSGMADLPSYVGNRVVNGHCDCMFLHNAYQWPWTRIAALIAPRSLLFVNSDQDRIFPMDANRRITNRLEQMYSLFGRGDEVESVVSMGDHAYRADIRQSAYRFINTHLKNDPRRVEDSEIDLVTGSRSEQHPIPPEQLRVFSQESDIPRDAKNATIDQAFVPAARVEPPTKENWADWKSALVGQLREVSFGYFPDRIPPARPVADGQPSATAAESGERLITEDGITIRMRRFDKRQGQVKQVVLVVHSKSDNESMPAMAGRMAETRDAAVYVCDPRGVGPSEWTTKNPPNYVERAHVLLGRTVETGQVWDIIATARMLRTRHGKDVPICLAGEKSAAVLVAYAALFEPDIDEVVLDAPWETHQNPAAPQILNVLRVCDVPQILGLLAPRKLKLSGCSDTLRELVAQSYHAAGGEW